MCSLAAEQTSSWLMVDGWEAFQNYQRTAVVLDHFDHEINGVLGGVQTQEGERRDVRVMLLAGSDLISTMSEPGVWSHKDVSEQSIAAFRSHTVAPARTHTWTIRHVHHRTCRLRHGPGHGQLGSVAAQHIPGAPAHSERRVLDKSPVVPPSGTISTISTSSRRSRLHRRERSILGRWGRI